jgi:hypothetical protein
MFCYSPFIIIIIIFFFLKKALTTVVATITKHIRSRDGVLCINHPCLRILNESFNFLNEKFYWPYLRKSFRHAYRCRRGVRVRDPESRPCESRWILSSRISSGTSRWMSVRRTSRSSRDRRCEHYSRPRTLRQSVRIRAAVEPIRERSSDPRCVRTFCSFGGDGKTYLGLDVRLFLLFIPIFLHGPIPRPAVFAKH